MGKLRVGLVQVKPVQSYEENIRKAVDMTMEAANRGCELVAISGICMLSPIAYQSYGRMDYTHFLDELSIVAKEKGIFIIGGSIPEPAGGKKFHSTCYVINDKGKIIGKYRKIHLINTNTLKGQYFNEQEWIVPGDETLVFDTPFCKIGVLQGYDIRFPRVCESLVDKGAKIIVFQGSFNINTGEHADTLLKCRALDNQVYLLGVSQARNDEAFYLSHGRSTITGPWGQVINQMGKNEGILIEELDIDEVEKIRNKLPVLKNRRI